jgi:hypothetical protein
MKIKYYIDEVERYPVYLIVEAPQDEDYRYLPDITAEELADYKRVTAAYNAWQARLGVLADERDAAWDAAHEGEY